MVDYQILDLVEEQWRETFLRFVDSGEAPPAFLEYFDDSPSAQHAAELAFLADRQRLRQFFQDVFHPVRRQS